MPDQGKPLIISASRRTDIPAFYSEWLINRIQSGYFVKVNPYNTKQQKQISLLPVDVAAFVFWTKNPLPLMPLLPLLDNRGYRYLFHFTLNRYFRFWEPWVPAFNERIATFQRLSEQIGPEKIIWRYDPIIVSDLDSVESHLERFSEIAQSLKGYTHQVMISLITIYDKVKFNLKKVSLNSSFQVKDLRAPEFQQELDTLMNGLSKSAKANDLTVYSCSERLDLSRYDIQPGSCIDSQLLNRLFDLHLKPAKDQYQRQECRCAPSVDMGSYDTCRFGCTYCYANTNPDKAAFNATRHHPTSPKLLDI